MTSSAAPNINSANLEPWTTIVAWVYTVEALEPLAVTAYSLDDGALVRRYGGRKGEGPGELLTIDGVALGAGGVFAAGGAVVNHWSLSGELLHAWRPVAPGVRTICSLAGQPAVAGQEGVVVRADDGRSIARGADTLRAVLRAGSVRGEASALYRQLRMACSDSVAYVLADHKITAYSPGGGVRQIPVPPEVDEIVRKRQGATTGLPGYRTVRRAPYSRMVTTADGRLFVTIADLEMAGAIVDPATGCYEVVKAASGPSGRRVLRGRRVLGLAADSLIFVDVVSEPETAMMNGKAVEVWAMSSQSIAIRPLRLVSGQPCGGG